MMIKKILSFVLAVGLAAAVHAQAPYPNRPIRLVVPFPAGGPTDVLARVLADDMGQRLGQPIIVDNKGGASGFIGQDFVAKAAPDGYTIVMITSTASNNYHFAQRPIDFYKMYEMIGRIYMTSTVLAVNPTVRGMENIRNLQQLVAYARKNPGKLDFTSTGNGSLGHLTMEKVKQQFGLNMQHIGYKGQAQALQDTLGGQVPMIAATFAMLPYIQKGQLRAIAVGSAQRSPLLPGVGTFQEQGMPGLVASAWVGLAAPGGTPKEIIQRLSRELRISLAKPESRARIVQAVGTEPEFLDGPELAAYATRDFQYWGKVIRETGIKNE